MSALRELDPEQVFDTFRYQLREACSEMLGRMDVCRIEERRAMTAGDYHGSRRWSARWQRRHLAFERLLDRRRALTEVQYGGRS